MKIRNDADVKKFAKGATSKVKGQIEEFYKAQTKIDEKAQKIVDFRREASRLASIANKRIERLERNKLRDAPAYKRYIQDGGAKFGVKGKTFNQVQSEVARLNRFLNSETSTIRGANRVLTEMAANTGIKYKNLKELRDKSGKFFELASKVEQYLRTVEDMASAIGYQKIWEAINVYTQAQGVDLSSGKLDVDQMTEAVVKALKEFDTPVSTPKGAFYIPKGQ